jgi:cell division protein FtsI/penicillin-binding protein 2
LLPERWLTEGEVALLAIGQGAVVVTPLQAAVMASVFANDGWLVSPWVVRAVGTRASKKMMVRRLSWSSKTLEVVRAGMRQVVEHPQGTAHRAFTDATTIAGKTGTAQTRLPGQPHGWFVGFCPVDAPRVAMAIVAEHGGSGGDLPTSIARAICEAVRATESLTPSLSGA